MAAKKTPLPLAGSLIRRLGVNFFTFLSHRSLLGRWVRGLISLTLIIFVVGYFSRELASGVLTVLVLGGVILALSKGSSSSPDRVGRHRVFAGNHESEVVDNDPFSQKNIHNSLFHESDFNSKEND